jgi:hypothetical protein
MTARQKERKWLKNLRREAFLEANKKKEETFPADYSTRSGGR